MHKNKLASVSALAKDANLNMHFVLEYPQLESPLHTTHLRSALSNSKSSADNSPGLSGGGGGECTWKVQRNGALVTEKKYSTSGQPTPLVITLMQIEE